jgi:hypothetical protein
VTTRFGVENCATSARNTYGAVLGRCRVVPVLPRDVAASFWFGKTRGFGNIRGSAAGRKADLEQTAVDRRAYEYAPLRVERVALLALSRASRQARGD